VYIYIIYLTLHSCTGITLFETIFKII
jgi:hypothetical protein